MALRSSMRTSSEAKWNERGLAWTVYVEGAVFADFINAISTRSAGERAYLDL